jgi:hypothetical protein
MNQKGSSVPTHREIGMRINRKELVLIILTSALILLVLANYLPSLLVDDDSAYYANQMLALRPGWMDGKPAFVWLGHVVSVFALWVGVPKIGLVFVLGLCSAVFMSLTSVNLYFIYRTLFGQRYLGILPGLFVAFSPIGFSSSLLISPYVTATFFVTLAVVAWLQRRFLTWSVAWALAISSHASSILLAFVWMASLLMNRDKEMAKRAVQQIPVTFMICLGFFGWVLSFYPNIGTFVSFSIYVTNKDYMLPITDQWFFQRIDALAESVGMLLLIFSMVGALLAAVRSRRVSEMFYWLTPYMGFYLLWGQGKFEKFYIFILPVLAIFAASAIDFLLRDLTNIPWEILNMQRKSVQRVLASSLFLMILIGGLLQGYGNVYSTKAEPNAYSTLAMQIDRWVTQENLTSGSVIIAGWETNYIVFYSPGVKVLGWYGSVFPTNQSQIVNLILLNVNRAHAQGQRVFMTKVWYYQEADGDPSLSFAGRIITNHYQVIEANDILLEVI